MTTFLFLSLVSILTFCTGICTGIGAAQMEGRFVLVAIRSSKIDDFAKNHPGSIDGVLEVPLAGHPCDAKCLVNALNSANNDDSDGKAISLQLERGSDAYRYAMNALGGVVVDEDLENFYAERLARSVVNDDDDENKFKFKSLEDNEAGIPRVDTGSMRGYLTLAEMETYVNNLSKSHPSVVGPFISVGCTYQGRHIWAFRVSTMSFDALSFPFPVIPDITNSGTCTSTRSKRARSGQRAENHHIKKDETTAGDDTSDIIDNDGDMDINENKSPISALADASGTPLRVTFTGQHHSREPLSTLLLLHFAAVLAARSSSDPAVAQMLASREIWILPVVNPDGVFENERTFPNGGGMRRKNMRSNGCTAETKGVDVNRNYGFKFAYDDAGSSGSKCMETYRGPSAFSEPESVAVKDFVTKLSSKFNLNYHTYGNLLLYPYGYEEGAHPPAADYFAYKEFSAEMARYNKYATGTGWSVPGLYVTNGEADDWIYGANGIFAMTSEAGSTTDGFWPATSRIMPIAHECYYMNWHMANVAGAVFNVSAIELSAAANGEMQIVFAVRNTGLSPSVGSVRATFAPTSGIETTEGSSSTAAKKRKMNGDSNDGVNDGLSALEFTTREVKATVASSLAARSTAAAPIAIPARITGDIGTVTFEISLADDQVSFKSSFTANIGGCEPLCTGSSHCDMLSRTCVCDQGFTGNDCTEKALTPDGSTEPVPEDLTKSSSATVVASSAFYAFFASFTLIIIASV